MYKSLFYEGKCDDCDKLTDVMTVGLRNTDRYDRNYCIKCLGNSNYENCEIDYVVNIVAKFFKVPIKLYDLTLHPDFNSIEKFILSYAIQDEDFVVMVNKRIKDNAKNYSFNVLYSAALSLRLSNLSNNEKCFFIFDPSKYREYEQARKKILEKSHISCSNKIFETDYNILIGTMNELFPLTGESYEN